MVRTRSRSHAFFANRPSSCRTIREIRDAIPERYFVRDTVRGLLFLARDLLLAAITWKLATFIDPFFRSSAVRSELTLGGAGVGRWLAWVA